MQAKILNGKILAYFLPPMPECTLHTDGLRLAQCLQDLYFANNKHIVEKYENHLMMKGTSALSRRFLRIKGGFGGNFL